MMTCYEPLLLCITMPIYVILLWVVWNKSMNKFMFYQSGLENTFVVFVWVIFMSLKDSLNIPIQEQ